jgi:nickel-type superoxide dismutase maturation protease
MGMLMLLHFGGRSARAHYPVIRVGTAGWLAVAVAVATVLRLQRVEVIGDSMRPALEPGDRLLILRTARVRSGDMVALVDPRERDRVVIKRVAACSPTEVTVLGDNLAASTDSRTFGPVRRDALRGRAVYRYFPVERRMRLGR